MTMKIDRTNLNQPVVPSAARPAAPNGGTQAAGDRLKLAADPHAVDTALAEIAHAQLPHRSKLAILHSQQDAWVRDAAGVVAKAYAALEVVEAGQQDVVAAKPEATVKAARAKVAQLAAEVAAHDPRQVRCEVLDSSTPQESAILHQGIDVGLPPQRGTMTKEQYAKAREDWARQQQTQITAARAVVAKQQDREELLHLPGFGTQVAFELDQAEKEIQRLLGPTQWGSLIRDMIEVGGALSDEVARQQGKPRRPQD